MGNPAEETCCHPNKPNLLFQLLFVNTLSRKRGLILWLDGGGFSPTFFPVAELESVNLFRNLAPDELKMLRAIAKEISIASGRPLFHEGDPGDGVYVIRNGLVEISATTHDKQSKVLSRLGPGEIFGEMAVIEDCPRSATATALRDTKLFFLPRHEMLALLQRSPAFAFNTLQEISRRLREFDRRHLQETVQAERLAILGNFARGIIHDLKTPLTIISLSTDLACMDGATAESRAQAQDRIHKQINLINSMVGDILEFTRGHSSKVNLPAARYTDFIAETLAEMCAGLEEKSVRIKLENSAPQAKAAFDPSRLRRVFFNLISNATDAMSGGGKIFVRIRVEKNEIITELEDTGSGIAPQIADKLFQPFATFGKSRGTGLGLSICKKIIEDHHGCIWIRNEPKRGAIFCFSLPLAK